MARTKLNGIVCVPFNHIDTSIPGKGNSQLKHAPESQSNSWYFTHQLGLWVFRRDSGFSSAQPILKKQRRLYFLNILRKSGASEQYLVKFYTGIIRPVCEYAAPVWATSLTQNQNDKLENIQKRTLSIIKPVLQYQESLQNLNLMTLEKRRLNICKDFFNKIQKSNDKIHDILPKQRVVNYNFRQQNKFEKVKCRTNRYRNSFLPYALNNF